MDIVQIKELIAILEGSQLNKLTLKDEKGCEIYLEKSGVIHAASVHHAPAVVTAPPIQDTLVQRSALYSMQTAKQEEVCGQHITSPMVGTFYLSPSPKDSSFIQVGDVVTENTIVCIIEAMKVMNEIKAGVRGKVVEMCIENGHAVEFGTKLFRVEV